jgi:hypothetical protein
MSDQDYIHIVLIDEFRGLLDKWGEEYQQPRDLGMRGEFVGLYRKARKIKSIVWDGASDATWREGLRVMLFEIIGHAFLMLVDVDETSGKRDAEEQE